MLSSGAVLETSTRNVIRGYDRGAIRKAAKGTVYDPSVIAKSRETWEGMIRVSWYHYDNGRRDSGKASESGGRAWHGPCIVRGGRHRSGERTDSMAIIIHSRTGANMAEDMLGGPSRAARAARRALRQAAGCGAYDAAPVQIIPGGAAPKECGRSWHYETRTGIPIRHPSAYSRRGWSSMIYVPSSRRVTVGLEWLRALDVVGGAP